MGRFDAYKRVTAGALVESDARGRAARTLRDLQVIDLRDAWVSAEAQAGVALHVWFTSGARSDRQDAYAAYIAALDREEAAASLLASRLAVLAGEPL
jgi:hypothetical protein